MAEEQNKLTDQEKVQKLGNPWRYMGKMVRFRTDVYSVPKSAKLYK